MTPPATQLMPQQVKAFIDAGKAYIVDVREPDEYAEAHIEGAVLLPLSRFDPAAVSPPEGKHLILHCRSGVRCGMASQVLRTAGYAGEINRMTGGLIGWLESGLPVVRSGGA